jgi:hypothetical protein
MDRMTHDLNLTFHKWTSSLMRRPARAVVSNSKRFRIKALAETTED